MVDPVSYASNSRANAPRDQPPAQRSGEQASLHILRAGYQPALGLRAAKHRIESLRSGDRHRRHQDHPDLVDQLLHLFEDGAIGSCCSISYTLRPQVT